MSYLEELLPEFKKGTKIRQPNWNNGEYIYLGENGIVYDERNKPFDFTNEELFAEWEFYVEPVDYDYIIKNKCLCWFWGCNFLDRKVDILGKVYVGSSEPFHPKNSLNDYENCRPVRRDEVTFYEDRKD